MLAGVATGLLLLIGFAEELSIKELCRDKAGVTIPVITRERISNLRGEDLIPFILSRLRLIVLRIDSE